MSTDSISSVVTTTQEYYDGPADEIYRTIWGDNLHLGIPRNEHSSHIEAMEHTNEVMANEVNLSPRTRVLDLGCGYGSTARYLAEKYGCPVVGTNISHKELELATERAKEAGLDHLLSFEYGDFHHIEYPEGSFDVVWSQEAFLHGADKKRILEECRRVLRPGGTLIFTDVLVRKETPEADRARIYDRIKSPDIWDRSDYEQALRDLNFEVQRVSDWSQFVAPSYGWVRDQVKAHRAELAKRVAPETIDKTIDALTFWVDSANDQKIGWALFVGKKPN